MVNYQISVWIPIYMLWMWTQTCTYPEQVRNKQWIIATLEKRYSMRKFVHLCVYQCRPCYPSGTKALKIYRLTQLFWLCCVRVSTCRSMHESVFFDHYGLLESGKRPHLSELEKQGCGWFGGIFCECYMLLAREALDKQLLLWNLASMKHMSQNAMLSRVDCSWLTYILYLTSSKANQTKTSLLCAYAWPHGADSYQPTSGFKFPGWRSHESHEISWKGMSSSYGQNKMGQ